MKRRNYIFFSHFLLQIVCLVIACLSIIPKSSGEKRQYFSLEHPKITFAHPQHITVHCKSRLKSRSDPIHYVDLNATLLKTIDSSYNVKVSFYQLLSNVYKRSFVEQTMSLCLALKEDLLIAPAFIDGFNRMPRDSRPIPELQCPLLPGIYILTNMTLPMAHMPAVFPFLEGRIYANLTRGNVLITSFQIDFQIRTINV